MKKDGFFTTNNTHPAPKNLGAGQNTCELAVRNLSSGSYGSCWFVVKFFVLICAFLSST